MAKFRVKEADGSQTEVEADRGEQDKASTRVTFYRGDTPVGSFINVQSWVQIED